MGAAPILTIHKNGEMIKSCTIEGEAMLGRAEGCVIRLDDRAISRQHVVFKAVEGGVQVEKRSEFAPLIVNGAETTRAIVREADVISIGPYLLRVSVPKSPPPQAPPTSLPIMPAVAQGQTQPLGTNPEDGIEQVETPAGEPNQALAEIEGVSNDGGLEGALDGVSAAANANDNGANAGGMGIEMGGAEGDPAADLAGGADGSLGLAMDSGVAPPDEQVEQADDDAKTKLTPMGKLNVRLVFAPGAANVTDYELNQDEVSLGRGKNCDIVLNDKKSSRKNTIIRRAGLSFSIKDLNSANGTFVNGVRVQEQELSGDDIVRIGAVEFQFKAESADYSARERGFMAVPEDPIDEDLPALDGMGDLGGMAGLSGMEPQQGLSSSNVQDPGMGALALPGAVPGVDSQSAGIPGITGIGPADVKRMSLIEKVLNFKQLPRRQQIIIGVIVIGFVYFLVFDEDDQATVKKKAVPKAGVVAATGKSTKGPATFETLLPEQQRFVEAQHGLAFDYYKNKDYDKSIFELNKIFSLINDYKDSRDIERYAREGKRKLEAFEEEKRKKEEEAQHKAQVAALVDECTERMKKKQYEQAKELFTQISLLDPDNILVGNWKKEIEQYEEDKRAAEQTKVVQAEINKRAWEVYNEALAIKKQGKYHAAIEAFGKVGDIGSSDQKPVELAKKAIRACYAAIRGLRDPVLTEAKAAEGAQDYPKAFALYKKATHIDPPHPAGYAGMARIRGVLHDRAKVVYTEAILAESFSDFATARKKFKETLEIAPTDDIYHDRAERKLARYFKREEALP